jgi:hypothetical protein
MTSLTFLISLLDVKVITPSIMTQIIHFQSLKEWQHQLSTPKNILCLLNLKTWNSYGCCVDLEYPLVLRMKSAGDSPDRGIERYKDFKKPFDELWEWAITPRFSLDRSVKDQLQNGHYG